MFKKIITVFLVASMCINLIVSPSYTYAETSNELFRETYADVEGKLSSADWIKLKGVDYESDCMSLYRPGDGTETKQLERKFSEAATGVVTIEYEFANIHTDGSIKPVQFELKAKDSAGATGRILVMQHAGNKVKIKEGSSYPHVKTINLNQKTTAKIVVDTITDKIWVSINGEELTEYPIWTDMDMAYLSSIYWTITSGKPGAGVSLFSMTAATTTNANVMTDEEKIQSDLDDIRITSSAAIKVDFTVPLTGENGSAISWTSDNGAAEVDNATGLVSVTRSDSDQNVKLTATGQLNGKSVTKVFDITVVKNEDTAKELFKESYADVEGKLSSADWIKLKGVDYGADSMSLYRPGDGTETKQLERKFSEAATGVVTIEYEFANIHTDGSIKPIQFELKAKDSAGATGRILVMQHAGDKVKIKEGSSYPHKKTVTINQKTTAKIVVDTITDKIWVSINGEELTEYPIWTDMDMAHLSSIYWTITSGKPGAGIALYSMKVSASTSSNVNVPTAEEKIQSDLEGIIITNQGAIEENFTVPVTGKNGSVISWISDNTAATEINNTTGLVTVTRGDSDQNVKLTATGELDGKSLTKAFDITIAKKATDEEIIQSMLDGITMPNAGIVKENFTVPVTGTNDILISWVSDNMAVVAVDNGTGSVTVTRGDSDQNVKLTATATLNGKSATKVFDITVLKVVDSANYLFTESYADVEGKLSSNWTTLKGVTYNEDCMTLYRSYTDTATKQLKRTFDEDANGVVTIEYDFANIGENNKPVQFFLKARNVDNEEVTILTTQHTPTVVRVRTVSETGQVVYKNLKDITTNQKYTAKIVVDTILDTVTLTVADKTQEYAIEGNEDIKHVSLMYWTITTDKKDVGMNLYQMSASASVTDELKIASDLAKIVLENENAIKENFTLPISGKLGSTFTWESNKPQVVAVNNVTGDAVITRMDADETVTLTVTGTLNGKSASKEFEIMVRRKLTEEEEKVEKDKEALNINNIVTSDLLLIRDGANGSKITWESSNKAVITNNGEVTIGDEDENVILTATIVYGNVTDTRAFNITVPKENTSSRPAQLERNMTDEEFLGIWHSESGEWLLKPKMNYGYKNDPILKAVEDSVKKGDYTEAKKLLLDYYVSKNRVIENPTNKRDSRKNLEYLLEDIYNKLTVFAEGTVSPEIGDNHFDITETVANKVLSGQEAMDLVMVNLDKNEEVIFDSREGANPPVLKIVADNKEYIANAIADSYIRGGKNGTKNYGSEKYLKALDSGMPVDDNSKRIYIRFELPELPASAEVQSAELVFYGFARVHNPEKPNESNVYDESTKLSNPAEVIICQSEEINFKESSVKWNSPLRIRYYSFKGNTAPYGGMDYIHTNKPGADKQFVNIFSRFWQQEGLIGLYEETGDEKYAARYIRELLVYYTKVGGGDLLVKPDVRGTNTQLNAGFRDQIITDSYYVLVKSKSMTPDDNLQILKFIYDDAEALLKPFYWERSKNNNWGMEMTVGNQSVIENFPEFATTDRNLDLIAERMSFLLGNLIRTDGAYIEGTNGYPVHIFENIYAYKKAMEELDYKVPDSLESQIKRFGTFFINCLEPNGYVAEYGDDHYDQKHELYEEIAELAKFENDDEMLYVSTDGKEGKEPLHKSAFYPDGRWATMRNGWDKDSIFSFANWMPIDTHSHNDVLALTLTAYGRRLLADTSDKSYNNDPISNWQRMSRFSHNVVAIDDISGYEMYKNNWSNPNLSSSADSDFTDAHDILTMQLVEKEMPKGDYVSNRKITFLKPLKFLIVSDHLDAVEGEHKYTQSWIFDPSASPTIDSETGVLRSNFSEGANVLVVPDSNAGMVQSIEDGYHQSQAIEYAKFVKNAGAVETFDTVLYPIKENEQTEVVTEKIDMGDNPLISAMTVEVKKADDKAEKGTYYITHEETPVYRTFGENGTDATMAYVNYGHANKVNYALIQNGTVLKDGKNNVIKSDVTLSDVSVEYEDKVMNIVSSEKVLANLGNLEILASPNVKVVKFNGVSVKFSKVQNVITLEKDDRENLALGKEVVGASAQVVDGDPNTSWQQGTFEYPHTVTLDLGEEKSVKEIEVLWGLSETQNGVYNYKLQTSLDGTKFVDVKADRGFERSAIKYDGKIRYIRLVIRDNTFYDPIEIREILVYEESNSADETSGGGSSGSSSGSSSSSKKKKQVRTEIKNSDIDNTLKKAKVNPKTGEKEAKIKVNVTKDTTDVIAKFGGDIFKKAKAQGIKRVAVDTGLAVVSLAPETLGNEGFSGNVEVEVKKVDGDKLDIKNKDVKKLIKDKPIFDFNLTVNGEKKSQFNKDKPVKVTVPYTLGKNEDPDNVVVYYLNDEGNLEIVTNGRYNPETGTVEFTTTHFSQYVIMEATVKLTDLNQAAWATDYVQYLVAREIAEGVTETEFAPNEDVTRDVYIAMLVRGYGLVDGTARTTFTDVTADHQYYTEIATAEKLGITKGIGDEQFGSGRKITREQMATMITRALDVLDKDLEVVTDQVAFSDDASIATYAKASVYAMQRAGILEGMGDGTYAPKETATRAQAAKVIYYLVK